MRRIAFFGISVTALLLTACALEEPVRKVTFESELALPAGTTTFAGDALIITVENIETLDADARYVAWGTGDADVALAELDPEQPLKIAVADLGDSEEILITEEDAGKALPKKPSSRERLRGTAGGALTFVGPDAEGFEEAGGSATLTGDQVEVHAENLPGLPDGLSYHVWVVMGAAHDDHEEGESADDHGERADTMDNAMDEAMGGMDEESEGESHEAAMQDMGALGGDGMLSMMGSQSMVTAAELRVTIESAHGADEISPCSVFHGHVMLPQSSGEAAPHGHMH